MRDLVQSLMIGELCQKYGDPWHWLATPSFLGGCQESILSRSQIVDSSWAELYSLSENPLQVGYTLSLDFVRAP